MLVLALTTMDKVRQLPAQDLANLGLAILVLVVAVFLIKQASRLNKTVVFLVLGGVVFVVGTTWVYQRNEPKFLTPFVDSVAAFFPKTPTPYSQRPEPGADKAKPAEPKTPPPPPSKVY
jgi:predicted membrane channel-forming protein YqfA (hemolysin III family)